MEAEEIDVKSDIDEFRENIHGILADLKKYEEVDKDVQKNDDKWQQPCG